MVTIATKRGGPARPLRLHAGELVRVRSAEEIRRTLDADGALDGLPFMPEMLAYCGRRFRVFKSAHKTCDTITKSGIRRMQDAVHLEGLRCDGSEHGGCQAGCLLFWKEAWVERVNDGELDPAPSADAATRVRDVLVPATRAAGNSTDGEEVFRCQATELLRATSPMSAWNPRAYLQDVWTGNVPLREFIWVLLVALFNTIQAWRGGAGYPRLQARLEKQTPRERLGLRPGEEVEVRSKQDIAKTLSMEGKNRGLWFDNEMLPYCGSSHRVERLVARIIDEKTGRMLNFRNDCVVLEGVTCRAWFSGKRLFCPRGITPYWREIWLRRAGEPVEK